MGDERFQYNTLQRETIIMSALDKQVGGRHYLSGNYQPVELWAALDLNGFQASIIEYVTRHKNKNGAEDIDKAIHFVELANCLCVDLHCQYMHVMGKEVQRFYIENKMPEMERYFISEMLDGAEADELIQILNEIKKENGYE